MTVIFHVSWRARARVPCGYDLGRFMRSRSVPGHVPTAISAVSRLTVLTEILFIHCVEIAIYKSPVVTGEYSLIVHAELLIPL